MNQNLAETVDKLTILEIKKAHGLPVDQELEAYRLDCQGIDSSELAKINQVCWDLEELVSQESDLSKLGAYCLALRYMTSKRIEAKNRISSKLNQPQEQKSY